MSADLVRQACQRVCFVLLVEKEETQEPKSQREGDVGEWGRVSVMLLGQPHGQGLSQWREWLQAEAEGAVYIRDSV